MFTPTETQLIPSNIRLAIMQALVNTGGQFHLPTLILFKNVVVVTPEIRFADLVECDFDGYAAAAGIVFSAAFYDVDDTALSLGGDQAFVATGGTTPNTVYGYALVDSGKTALYAIYQFQSPRGISRAGDACPVVPAVRYSGT